MIQFTGNWYIDMGTIGMLKLIHNEFPEDSIEILLQLDERQLLEKFEYAFFKAQLSKREGSNSSKIEKYRAIEKDEKKEKKTGKSKTLKPKEKKELAKLTKLANYHKALSDSLTKKKRAFQSFDEVRYKDDFKDIVQDKESRIPLDSNAYKNLWFFNLSKDYTAQKQMIEDLFHKDETKILESTLFDRSINKLLYSGEEMPNAVFANTSVSQIVKNKTILFSLLSLENFTTTISRTNYFFYSPDLIFTYNVNMSMGALVAQLSNKRTDILRITYQSIFDNLYKTQSDWALSNMILISFKGLDNKGVKDFTTLSIRKFEAIVLNDEQIRESLNTSLYQGTKQAETWLIRSLIEEESIFKRVLRAARYDKFLSGSVLRTALSVELTKKDLYSQKRISVFDFKNLLTRNDIKGKVPLTIKSHIKDMSYASKNYYSAVKKDNLQNEMHFLIQIIQHQQQFKFTNFIINKLLTATNDKIEAKNRVTQYLFENIINKPNWEYYALGMIFKNFNQTVTE